MGRTNSIEKFELEVAEWCKRADKFYNKNRSINLSDLPGVISGIGQLEKDRQQLRQEIRDQDTRKEREQFTKVYDFIANHSGRSYIMHSDMVSYLRSLSSNL